MTTETEMLSPAEQLFILHPNDCTSSELLQLAMLDLTFRKYITMACESRVIHRKRAGDIKRRFFRVSRAGKDKVVSKGFEEVVHSHTTDSEIILQHFVGQLDKSLNGIGVFKSLVFEHLNEMRLVESSFSFFGLLTPRYTLTNSGTEIREQIEERISSGHFPDSVSSLLSTNTEERVLKGSRMMDVPDELAHLKLINSSEWNSKSATSGLDPKGFLPI